MESSLAWRLLSSAENFRIFRFFEYLHGFGALSFGFFGSLWYSQCFLRPVPPNLVHPKNPKISKLRVPKPCEYPKIQKIQSHTSSSSLSHPQEWAVDTRGRRATICKRKEKAVPSALAATISWLVTRSHSPSAPAIYACHAKNPPQRNETPAEGEACMQGPFTSRPQRKDYLRCKPGLQQGTCKLMYATPTPASAQ